MSYFVWHLRQYGIRKDNYNYSKKYLLIFWKPTGKTAVFFELFCIRLAGCQPATFKRCKSAKLSWDLFQWPDFMNTLIKHFNIKEALKSDIPLSERDSRLYSRKHMDKRFCMLQFQQKPTNVPNFSFCSEVSVGFS